MEFDQKFLEYVVKGLVDTPDAVKVQRTVDEMGVLLTLDVDAADMGKIIGRSGNTAKAIRTLLRVVGMKNNSRVNLKINEPEGGLRSILLGRLELHPFSKVLINKKRLRALFVYSLVQSALSWFCRYIQNEAVFTLHNIPYHHTFPECF